jgi:hypothetical protein
MSSNAAGDAADAQAQSAAQSDATQRYQYDTTRADNAPFRETGLAANNKLTELMNGGSFARRFTSADMNADPVYQSGLQFGLDQGTQGINRQAAAGGFRASLLAALVFHRGNPSHCPCPFRREVKPGLGIGEHTVNGFLPGKGQRGDEG